MGASARGASCQEVRSTLASAAALNAPSLDESLPAYRISASMASHSGSALSARGPTGAGGLRALASLAGVSPAGRGMPSSRLVVDSASVLVSGGASLKPEAIPASVPAVTEALPSSPLGSACARCSGSLAEACGNNSPCPTPVSAAVA